MRPADALARQLAEFRAAHVPATLGHGGNQWRYLRGGRAGDAVMLLTGALGRAEFGFQQIALLERSFRVIAPDYPAVDSLAVLLDGLLAILDAEGAPRAHVVGGSFGGLVAQALVRRAPQRVASLVLSHTAAPDGGRRRSTAAVALSWLPAPALRALLRGRLGRTLEAADPFWRHYFDEMVGTLSKAEILSRVRLAAEFGAQAEYRPTDLAGWPGRVLVLEGGDDPLFQDAARSALRALYPGAEVYAFRGTGHAAAVLRPEEYSAALSRFLAGA